MMESERVEERKELLKEVKMAGGDELG